MKKHLLILFSCMVVAFKMNAQVDTIYTKGNQQILCSKIKETAEEYKFNYTNQNNEKARSSILKYLVDSIKFHTPIVLNKKQEKENRKKLEKLKQEENLINDSTLSNKAKRKKKRELAANTNLPKAWKYTVGFGINLGNIIEFNNPSGTDKKGFDANAMLDLGLNYYKDQKRFNMSNELHWNVAMQKNGLTSAAHVQRTADVLTTLHDFSEAIGKTKKWNFNVITKTNTSVFTIFNGDFFTDVNRLGKIQKFASPYDIIVSPGIKWQPNQNVRLSLSPYSFNILGVKNAGIRNKGIFITDTTASGAYKKSVFKRLGAEINFWYDKQIKTWLTMQYRIGISSNYFEKITKNGLLDGLFITRFKLIKDIYLTHRAGIRGDFAITPFKPYYNQAILLSYSKRF